MKQFFFYFFFFAIWVVMKNVTMIMYKIMIIYYP